MEGSIKNILLACVVITVIFLAGFLTRQCTFKLPEPEIIERRDTSTYYDTLFFAGPKLSELIVNTKPLDTLWLQGETKVIHDSVFFALPREEVEYKDSSFRAVVSGFMPRLEEMEIYNKEKVITIQTEKVYTEYKHYKFGVGIQAGYGITPSGFQPYLGLGVSYNLFGF